MKRLVETNEGEFDEMMGESICLLCANYIYTGIVIGANNTHIELKEPRLVYDTGSWGSDHWEDAQCLPSPWRVRIDFVESWGVGK